MFLNTIMKPITLYANLKVGFKRSLGFSSVSKMLIGYHGDLSVILTHVVQTLNLLSCLPGLTGILMRVVDQSLLG